MWTGSDYESNYPDCMAFPFPFPSLPLLFLFVKFYSFYFFIHQIYAPFHSTRHSRRWLTKALTFLQTFKCHKNINTPTIILAILCEGIKSLPIQLCQEFPKNKQWWGQEDHPGKGIPVRVTTTEEAFSLALIKLASTKWHTLEKTFPGRS